MPAFMNDALRYIQHDPSQPSQPSPNPSDGSHYEKRGKGEPVCIDDEIPFEIPESWEWVRLESLLADVIVPIRDKPTKLDGPIPWCRIEDVEGRYLSRSLSGQGVDEATVQKMNLKVYPIDTVLCSNSATIGVPAIITTPCVTNQRFIGFLPAGGFSSEYLYLLFLAFNKELTTVGTGTTHAYISRGKFEQLLVPLPPEHEQKSIVGAFDAIEPIVNQYGALEDDRERLDAELPSRLRKSILQMAVQGKLVEQDPSDEPASVLLERIRAERAKLAKAGKLKAPKGGESIIYRASDGGYYEKRGRCEQQPIEVPFDIPDSWEWARIGSVFDMQAGKNIAAANISDVQDEKHPYPCFGGNGIRGYVQAPNRNGRFPIVGRQGALCGCINYAEGEFYATEHAVVTTCFDKTDVSWACIALEALNLNQYATATAQPGLAVSKIADVFIPVPPAGEQTRIAGAYEAYKRFTNQ